MLKAQRRCSASVHDMMSSCPRKRCLLLDGGPEQGRGDDASGPKLGGGDEAVTWTCGAHTSQEAPSGGVRCGRVTKTAGLDVSPSAPWLEALGSPAEESARPAFRGHPRPPLRDPWLLSPGPQLSVKSAVTPASGVCGDPRGSCSRLAGRCWLPGRCRVSGDSIPAEFWEEPRPSPLPGP